MVRTTANSTVGEVGLINFYENRADLKGHRNCAGGWERRMGTSERIILPMPEDGALRVQLPRKGGEG